MRVFNRGVVMAGEGHHIELHLLTQSMIAVISLDINAEDARDFLNELSNFWASLNDHRAELMQKTDKSALASTVHWTNWMSMKNSFLVGYEY